jgi:hypothetical protein
MTIWRAFLAGALVASCPAVTAAQTQEARVAVLRGLDKITARVSTFEAPLGQEVRFGTLRILVRNCRTRPPEEPPETTAFLEISDQRPGDIPRVAFSGWMFASSPALSALEHPIYDVWVIDCRASATRQ